MSKVVGFGIMPGSCRPVASALHGYLDSILKNGTPSERAPTSAIRGMARILELAHLSDVKQFNFPPIPNVEPPTEYQARHLSGYKDIILGAWYEASPTTYLANLPENNLVIRSLMYWNSSLQDLKEIPPHIRKAYERINTFYKTMQENELNRERRERHLRGLEDDDD